MPLLFYAKEAQTRRYRDNIVLDRNFNLGMCGTLLAPLAVVSYRLRICCSVNRLTIRMLLGKNKDFLLCVISHKNAFLIIQMNFRLFVVLTHTVDTYYCYISRLSCQLYSLDIFREVRVHGTLFRVSQVSNSKQIDL